MRIGLNTPVVVQVPGVASAWETDAGIAELAQVAEAADALGYDYLTCSEHVAVPSAAARTRGAVYWDPLATLSFLAARTTAIRLATSVLVLAYHHPLALAKQYGTLDRLSGGRLVLGVGIGSLTEEFEVLGAPWDQRAARADDAIAALRASLSHPEPRYRGPFYRYDGMTVLPHAQQPHVPLWVGGRSRRSLQRAIRSADGWMPFGLSDDRLRALLDKDRPGPGFDVVLATSPLDPGARPDAVRDRLRALRDLGATAVTATVAATDVDHYCAQLAALKAIADEL